MKTMITNSIETAGAPMTKARDWADRGNSDIARLEQVYDEYACGLLRYARALLGSVEDAEDAVQEVFVRLARDSKKLSKVEDLRGYLLKATRNAVYGSLRGKQRHERLIAGVTSELNTIEPESCLPEVEAVLEAFAVLPVEQREVMALKVFQGLTFREIAGVIGKSQNTVSSRYRYAVERIREQVGEE